jgi:hypothetical protein
MRRGGLRAINQGTRYDVSGKLRNIVRSIESGEIAPRDVIVITREIAGRNKSCKVGLFHFGTGSTEDVHWMLSTAKNRVEPS